MHDSSLFGAHILAALRESGPTDPSSLMAHVQASHPEITPEAYSTVVSTLTANGRIVADHVNGSPVLKLPDQSTT